MMDTKFRFILFTAVMVIAAVMCFEIEQREQVKLNALSFNNIEALANNEGGSQLRCMDYGSVDCLGFKVKYKYEFTRLEPVDR